MHRRVLLDLTLKVIEVEAILREERVVLGCGQAERLERELASLRQERDEQQRQEHLAAELQQAAVALAELKRLLDQGAGRAAG